jgi:hypothetical protein
MRLFRITACTILLVAASAATGQTRPGDIVVDVPFAFVAAGQAFPAGHYIVTKEGDRCLRIFNSQQQGVYVQAHASLRSDSDGSKLVFHRYGDTYFLSAVWVTGNTIGRELFRSRAERELAAHKAEMELAVVHPERLHPEKLHPAK